MVEANPTPAAKVPCVSIVVPTRNCRAELARLLDSIDRQTFRDLEVIVVDNFSTDGTFGMAAQSVCSLACDVLGCFEMEPGKDVIEEMTRTLVREADPERVYLFGSHARGDQRPGSDVDFLVVVREGFGPRHSRWKELCRMEKGLRGFRLAKDILLYSTDEFNYWRDSLNHVVGRTVREGRLLYERP